MKNSTFIQLFIGIHVCLVVAHIYRHTRFVRASFKRQRVEQMHFTLQHRQQELMSQLYAQQDRDAIKKQMELRGMKSASIKQVKKITS